MLIIPAIDIKDGKVVRLKRGEFDKIKVYSDNPVSVAKRYEADGAKLLHIVDLDGALSGELKNLDAIKEILKGVDIPLQIGGGIRTLESIKELLNIGAHRIILGTCACEDEAFIKNVLDSFAEKIVISIDAKDGIAATHGWSNISGIKADELVRKLEFFGLKLLIYTDISRDGMLAGPNIEAIKTILRVRDKILVISSGGISSLKDLLELKKLEAEGLFGVIIGKALYEKKIDLKEAIEKC